MAVRHKMNLTQRGLANIIGVSPRTVEAREAGANMPGGSSRRLPHLLAKDKNILSLLKA